MFLRCSENNVRRCMDHGCRRSDQVPIDLRSFLTELVAPPYWKKWHVALGTSSSQDGHQDVPFYSVVGTLSILLCRDCHDRDAEEYGLIGSVEFIETYFKTLSAQTIAYLNVDIAVNLSTCSLILLGDRW